MQVPAAAFLEIALEGLKTRIHDPAVVAHLAMEANELLDVFGVKRLTDVMDALEAVQIDAPSMAGFVLGYLFRGEVDRVLLETMPAAVAAGVTL